MSLLRIVRDWTLPAAMVSGSGAYLLFAHVSWLDAAGRLFGPLVSSVLPVLLFLVLFVTFCKVDYHKLRPVGWHLRLSVLQIAVVSAVMGIVVGFRLDGNSLVLAESLLCCIIAPTAAAAAVVTQKLGGQLEEMTTYTFVSNFITAVLIPTCFPLLEKSHDVSFVVAFSAIMREVVVVLLAPMLLGYVVKRWLSRVHQRIVGVKDLSYYLWAVMLMIVSGTTVRSIVQSQASALLLGSIAFCALTACVCQFALGRLTGCRFGRAVEAGQALGQKNTAFAIWTANVYLNPLSSVGPGCYILWQNIINSIEIRQEQKRQRALANS